MDNPVYHKPVLINEVLHYLNPTAGKTYVDVTFGGGGHTRAILEAEPNCHVIAVDWDTVAIETNAQALKDEFGDRFTILWGNFAHLLFLLKKHGIKKVDGILADFGTSQFQIKEKSGFSFAKNSPLDMRMSPAHQKITAAYVVNNYPASKLREIFWAYGEDRYTNKIVEEIIAVRGRKSLQTTAQLAELIEKIVPEKRDRRTHPATKIFQALRIYVNDELGNINAFLAASLSLLNKDGRLVCISFHSLEDRIVKQFLMDHKHTEFKQGFEILTRKIVTATDDELRANPSSRSAKLRAAKLC